MQIFIITHYDDPSGIVLRVEVFQKMPHTFHNFHLGALIYNVQLVLQMMVTLCHIFCTHDMDVALNIYYSDRWPLWLIFHLLVYWNSSWCKEGKIVCHLCSASYAHQNLQFFHRKNLLFSHNCDILNSLNILFDV